MTDWHVQCKTCKRSGVRLKRCSACCSVSYCSRECQKHDWPDHKKICDKEQTGTASICLPRKGASNNGDKMFNDQRQKGVEETESSVRYIQEALIDENGVVSIHGRDCDVLYEHHCAHCKTFGATKSCSKCKIAFYCSKPCQRADWPEHRKNCQRIYTKEEKKIIEEKQRDKKAQREQAFIWESEAKANSACSVTFANQLGGLDRYYAMLTPDQALINENRPAGSLRQAVKMASLLYPLHNVITMFNIVPWEPLSRFESIVMLNRPPSVLVAFMYSYHEHVMRHGVYLKDADDKESKVEFYLDGYGDNPFPFFTYAKVKPGSYICIENPLMHAFMDGSNGLKIQDPRVVKILEKDRL